ncbi:type II toxin-antitoxin system VapC family toxin [Desulfonema magnum]|uniref:PIN domain-containing protein n=1 Tax=Desulfonema magnum TaxID=45655 RepID=A0A975GMJ4_9BACT|nr:type II toxin-antitoxin system VapC family toxin [Desulfonema magnum]QTA86759.1 PIN domain-containing protein [Desulfonema magnum]
MHILDTDTLTHLHAGHPNVIANLKKLDDPDVRITVITKIELLRGRFEFLLKASDRNQLVRAQKLLNRTEELLSQIPVLMMDEKSATRFEELKKLKKLHKIGRADILIASMTLAHQAVLVTRNVRHFKHVPNLALKNWVD